MREQSRVLDDVPDPPAQFGAWTSRMSRPRRLTVPAVGSTMRLIMRSVVVLPQPEGPTRTVMPPSASSRDSSSTAVVPFG